MPAKDLFEFRPFKPSADRLPELEPTIVYTTEIREPGTVAAWWVGGLVTIVAILAATFVVTRNPNSDLQVASVAAPQRLQGTMDSQPAIGASDANLETTETAATSTPATTVHPDGSAEQAAVSPKSANTAAVNASASVSDPAAVRTTAFASSTDGD